MAAAALGRPPIQLVDLVAELSWPDGTDVGFVETAGGARSPLSDDGDALDLIRLLGPDMVIVVADAGLGTVNAVRLTVAAVAPVQARPPVVHLNRFEHAQDLHQRNRSWLTERDDLTVTTDIETLSRTLTVSPVDRHRPNPQSSRRSRR
jgi:dethiobiotin synthetase